MLPYSIIALILIIVILGIITRSRKIYYQNRLKTLKEKEKKIDMEIETMMKEFVKESVDIKSEKKENNYMYVFGAIILVGGLMYVYKTSISKQNKLFC